LSSLDIHAFGHTWAQIHEPLGVCTATSSLEPLYLLLSPNPESFQTYHPITLKVDRILSVISQGWKQHSHNKLSTSSFFMCGGTWEKRNSLG